MDVVKPTARSSARPYNIKLERFIHVSNYTLSCVVCRDLQSGVRMFVVHCFFVLRIVYFISFFGCIFCNRDNSEPRMKHQNENTLKSLSSVGHF
jgi:hypothetical protein